ncbi:uncharacterized protein LOC144144557 [Haemaphysalis longicornis]
MVPLPSACCCIAAFLLVFSRLGSAFTPPTATSTSARASTLGSNNPVFNSSSPTAADNREFARNATPAGNVRRQDAAPLSLRPFAENAVDGAAASVVVASQRGGSDVRQPSRLARARRHFHHHHGHHFHHHGGSLGGGVDASLGGQFDNAIFRTLGLLDSNTCVSKFVCEVVARRGAHSFIGTTLGDIFKGLSRAPAGSPAHSVWRAAAIGKHGWLPVCSSAFPDCASKFSTFLSILNVLG